MALEVFALLDDNGDHNSGCYIFCGKKADLLKLARPLEEFYAANRRKKKVEALAAKIVAAAQQPTPLVRLEKAEGAVLMDVISAMAEGRAASHSYSKLYERFEDLLCVYG
jgi:hypothetical protein